MIPHDVLLASQTDLTGFHLEATRLLALQIDPAGIGWHAPGTSDSGPCDLVMALPGGGTRAARALVPQSFIRKTELVVLHRDEIRFELLYRTLWRLVHEPHLREDTADPDLALLNKMADAVRRDIQKMKTRMVFRQIVVNGRALGFAWCEPTHHICEAVARWLAKRQPGVSWLLLTPDRALRWEGGRLLSAPPLSAAETPAAAASDAAWELALAGESWA